MGGHASTNTHHRAGASWALSSPSLGLCFRSWEKHHGAGLLTPEHPPHIRPAAKPGLDDKANWAASAQPWGTLSQLGWVASTGYCLNAMNAFHGTSTQPIPQIGFFPPSEPNTPQLSHGQGGRALRLRGGPRGAELGSHLPCKAWAFLPSAPSSGQLQIRTIQVPGFCPDPLNQAPWGSCRATDTIGQVRDSQTCRASAPSCPMHHLNLNVAPKSKTISVVRK